MKSVLNISRQCVVVKTVQSQLLYYDLSNQTEVRQCKNVATPTPHLMTVIQGHPPVGKGCRTAHQQTTEEQRKI